MTEIQKRLKALEMDAERRRGSRERIRGIDVTKYIAPVYLQLHADIEAHTHTVYNLPGGRGSCKSSFVSLEIVNGVMADPTGHSNAIVFRLVAGTMRDSVYAQIGWAIETLGVGHLWKGNVSPMNWTYLPTGAQIVFRGLDNPLKLKSIKPIKGIFKYIWLEEFAELPGPNFVRNVMQSVQRGGDNFIVFRSFNPPISKNNWANTFIQEPDERAITLLTNYTMIPPEWLGDAFLYEAERLREVNNAAFQHEYMGIPTGTGGEVFPNLEIRRITDEEIDMMEYFYYGLDFGFAADPACFLRLSYDRKHEVIYLLAEIYQRGLSNTKLADLIKGNGYDYTGKVERDLWGNTYRKKTDIIADAAEPKSINDLQQAGLRCRACYKKPGCVEYRIKWMQCRKIVIDPQRTPNAYREFVNYSYGTDKDGNILSVLPDKDNHSIDSCAYALSDLIFHTRGQSA